MKKEVISVMQRYELKYILSKEQAASFTNEILKHMNIDEYGLTSICSLYYDTPNCTLVNKSIEKPFFKEKLRLRSYGLVKDDKPVFLEIKRKLHKIVYKRRIITTEEKANQFFNNDKPFDKTQISQELTAFKQKHRVLIPKYLIIYDRIALYQDNSDIRITIDKNPRYRIDDLNLHTSLEGIPLLKEGEAILEIKVQNSIPLWLVDILTKEKIYQTSFSKVGTAHLKELAKHQNNSLVLISPQKEINLEGGYNYGFGF